MSKKIIYSLAICSILFIAACSSIESEGVAKGILRDDNADIVKAYSVAPLKTPPGMKSIPYDPYYVVPGAASVRNVKPVSLLPPGSLAAKQAN